MLYEQLKQNNMENRLPIETEEVISSFEKTFGPSLSICFMQLCKKGDVFAKKFLTRVHLLKMKAISILIKRINFIFTKHYTLSQKVVCMWTAFDDLMFKFQQDSENYFKFLFNNNPKFC